MPSSLASNLLKRKKTRRSGVLAAKISIPGVAQLRQRCFLFLRRPSCGPQHWRSAQRAAIFPHCVVFTFCPGRLENSSQPDVKPWAALGVFPADYGKERSDEQLHIWFTRVRERFRAKGEPAL